MPVFQVDIEKQLGSEYWTNSYHLSSDDMAAAAAESETLFQAEKAIHLGAVLITKVRISDMVPDNETFIVITKNETGLSGGSSGTGLPLFCAVRVDFQAAAGRNGRKYLRGVLTEADQNDFGVINQTMLDFINTNYGDPVIVDANTCKPDGTMLVDWSTHNRVAMRQLRRGSKRTQPVLP